MPAHVYAGHEVDGDHMSNLLEGTHIYLENLVPWNIFSFFHFALNIKGPHKTNTFITARIQCNKSTGSVKTLNLP